MTTWLLTSTFYGQWLPGDARGSVTNVLDRRPDDLESESRIEHAQPGDGYEDAIPGLERAGAEQLKGPRVVVNLAHAEALLEQFQETARVRGWDLLAVSIMYNHVHFVVAAPSEVDKSQLLRDFKSYGARRLNQHFGRRPSGTWWSDGGSCRPVRHLESAIFYVCHRQPKPLVVWNKERGRISSEESDPANEFSGNLPPLTREAR
jgi:REP element-mobilizing transposase RayT